MLAQGGCVACQCCPIAATWPVTGPSSRPATDPGGYRCTSLRHGGSRVRHTVGNERFYSWPKPLSQNWASQGPATAWVLGLA